MQTEQQCMECSYTKQVIVEIDMKRFPNFELRTWVPNFVPIWEVSVSVSSQRSLVTIGMLSHNMDHNIIIV